MARARNIKPGFFKNDALCELPPMARLLFAGLWTIADREGRMEDRPKRIKAEIFPYDEVDIDELLARLSTAGFIQRYMFESERYIEIPNWGKHQNPHVKEPASTIPAPCKNSASTVQAPVENRSSRADSGFLIPDSGLLHSGAASGPDDLAERIEGIINRHPQDKRQVLKVRAWFQNEIASSGDPWALLAAIENWHAGYLSRIDNPKYCKGLRTLLDDGDWLAVEPSEEPDSLDRLEAATKRREEKERKELLARGFTLDENGDWVRPS